jgi:hypothetical protein
LTITAPVHIRCVRDYRLPAIALAAAGAATATAPTESTTAAGTRLLRARFVHRQCPAAHLRAVESGNSSLRLCVRRHLDEAEAARLSRELIRNDPRGSDSAMPPEQIALNSCSVAEYGNPPT